jgi:hypothetical protein
VLRPTKQFSDGTHRLSIQLRPDDLGAVTVELALHDGRLSLHFVAENRAAADTLRASMHELRSELETTGQRTGSFEVGQHSGRGDRGQDAPTGERRATFADYVDDPSGVISRPAVAAVHPTTARSVTGSSRLDVRI